MILVATLYVYSCGFVHVTHTPRVTAKASTSSTKRKQLVNAVRASTQSLLPSKIKCENVQIRFCGWCEDTNPYTCTHTHTPLITGRQRCVYATQKATTTFDTMHMN